MHMMKKHILELSHTILHPKNKEDDASTMNRLNMRLPNRNEDSVYSVHPSIHPFMEGGWRGDNTPQRD